MKILSLIAVLLTAPLVSGQSIDREKVVKQFNPIRTASSNSTPMQVGNGNFAFGVDITGLQTFEPFNTLSSWGWHNFSLPTASDQSTPSSFTGLDWLTHGRLVNYDQPNPAEPLISNWLIQNPQRLNLGSIGFWFDDSLNITGESLLSEKSQTLDLYSGAIFSQFSVRGSVVKVRTTADPTSDTVSIQIQSDLIPTGQLGVFFDYPYSDVNKFDAPFVGVWNLTSLHTTSLQQNKSQAQIIHNIDATTYYTSIKWEGNASISGLLNSTHRYVLQPIDNGGPDFNLTAHFSPSLNLKVPDANAISTSSSKWWENYWETGAFVDLTATNNTNATELQRRIILSQYHLMVNEAGNDPPQESGLVSNGWYGKFHAEMFFWHLGHWARWGKWPILNRAIPGVYERFMSSSIDRARDQGYQGARWGKMSDPTGRSAPGEINSLLIWQQPHPFYFAELEWREFPSSQTLRKWDEILTQTADFMVSFAFWNSSTGVYDLGPPIYPVSESTNPNMTINPTFELAYWRFGLGIASQWKERQNLSSPSNWTHVAENLAPLPVFNDTYPVYEGIQNMWVDPQTYYDHPAMTGIYGLLPPTPGLNLTIMQNTATKIAGIWNFKELFGWDFPMLAMNSARLGNTEDAVGYLLHVNFPFDDIGMPIGGDRVATPYFPGSSSLLLAVAMLSGGWDGMEGSQWPKDWEVKVEGFVPGL